MTFDSAGLNEVLLQAAIRAERINAAKVSEQRASDLAKRFDVISVSHRVPVNITQGLRDDNPTAVSIFNQS